MKFSIIHEKTLKPNQIEIQHEDKFFPHLTKSQEDYIEKEWKKSKKKVENRGGQLFNGDLFQYINSKVVKNGLKVNVASTNYMMYVVTRTKEFTNYFSKSEKSFPLAVSISIITSDNYIVLNKRKGVDLDEGKFHVIGGFMDRNCDFNEKGLPDPFHAISREVKEEIGIDINVRTTDLLGIINDNETPHYEFCFRTKLNITFSQLLNYFENSDTDGELNNLKKVKNLPEILSNFIQNNHDKISATGEAYLLLLGKKQFGQSWLDKIHILKSKN